MTGSKILRGWEGSGCGDKNDNKRDPYSDGNGLNLDCVNVNILEVLFSYCSKVLQDVTTVRTW